MVSKILIVTSLSILERMQLAKAKQLNHCHVLRFLQGVLRELGLMFGCVVVKKGFNKYKVSGKEVH
jgi:hypothetical protein